MEKTSKYREMECRYGRMRFLAHDTGVGRSLATYGEYSESELALWRGLLRPGDVVVTAGANIGCHLIPLSRMCKHVYTAEPNPLVADLAVYNCIQNNCENVTLVVGAFSDKRGMATMMSTPIDKDTNYGGAEIVEGGNIEFPTMPIDELALTECAMIHLDVEGHELEVLVGAEETIQRCLPYLYVEVNKPEKNDQLLAYISSIGYQTMIHYAPVFNPQNFFGNRHNIFSGAASIMALCIPDRKEQWRIG
jgi:FkbM family methyltransferase